jgi:hypothetical protein
MTRLHRLHRSPGRRRARNQRVGMARRPWPPQGGGSVSTQQSRLDDGTMFCSMAAEGVICQGQSGEFGFPASRCLPAAAANRLCREQLFAWPITGDRATVDTASKGVPLDRRRR